jgi:hypothetical protein
MARRCARSRLRAVSWLLVHGCPPHLHHLSWASEPALATLAAARVAGWPSLHLHRNSRLVPRFLMPSLWMRLPKRWSPQPLYPLCCSSRMPRYGHDGAALCLLTCWIPCWLRPARVARGLFENQRLRCTRVAHNQNVTCCRCHMKWVAYKPT